MANSTYKLFIDDKQAPPDESSRWIIAKSSQEAIAIMQQRGIPQYISFGYDLMDKDTVIPAMHWLMDVVLSGKQELPPSFDFFVHSTNAHGKKIVENSLSTFIKFTHGKF